MFGQRCWAEARSGMTSNATIDTEVADIFLGILIASHLFTMISVWQ
jgi:hypothetical protein